MSKVAECSKRSSPRLLSFVVESVKRHRPPTQLTWSELHRPSPQMVTGSFVPNLLGVGFDSHQLAYERMAFDRRPPPTSQWGQDAIDWGTKLEPLALQRAREILGEGYAFFRPGSVIHPDEQWLGVTPDEIAVGRGRVVLIEVKTSIRNQFSTPQDKHLLQMLTQHVAFRRILGPHVDLKSLWLGLRPAGMMGEQRVPEQYAWAHLDFGGPDKERKHVDEYWRLMREMRERAQSKQLYSQKWARDVRKGTEALLDGIRKQCIDSVGSRLNVDVQDDNVLGVVPDHQK